MTHSRDTLGAVVTTDEEGKRDEVPSGQSKLCLHTRCSVTVHSGVLGGRGVGGESKLDVNGQARAKIDVVTGSCV